MTDRASGKPTSIMRIPCGGDAVRTIDSASARRPPLRIAINAIVEPAPKFGSRVYLWELAAALATMNEIDLVLLVGKGQAKQVPPTLRSHARELPVSGGKSYWQIFRQKRIREALLQHRINCYHLPNTIPLLRNGMPAVVTIHDLVDLQVKKYGVLRTAYRFLVNFVAARLAHRVLTVSENSKRDIVRLLRIPESKVTVIYNGVGEEFRPLNRRDCKDYLASRYSITSEFLLAPGGFSRNKNIQGLLTTIRLLKEAGRQEALVILGDTEGLDFQRVALSIRRSGLDGAVMVPGFVPREELPVFYNAASLVVYPTLYEGFGLPVLEAMACGTPIVTSNTSSVPEVAGDAALLVDPRNPREITSAVQQLLTDTALRAELSSRGVVRARQFTWKKTAERTVQVFLEVALAQEAASQGGRNSRF